MKKLSEKRRFCVAKNDLCRHQVMFYVHNHPIAGHMGARKTYIMVAWQAWWPRMANYFKVDVDMCTNRRIPKSSIRKLVEILQSRQISNK